MGRPSISMQPIPLPERLPGTFCVFNYDRELETFSLMVNDGTPSAPLMTTYDLGEDSHAMRTRIKKFMPENPDIMENGLDAARNFGSGQVVFATQRALALKPKINHEESELDHGFRKSRMDHGRV